MSLKDKTPKIEAPAGYVGAGKRDIPTPKTNEERITELERKVSELKQQVEALVKK